MSKIWFCLPVLALLVSGVAVVIDSPEAWAQVNFSVNNGAVGVLGSAVNVTGGDVAHVFYSALNNTNTLAVPKAALGLQNGDNVDALAIVDGGEPDAEQLNWPALYWFFSVDPASAGVLGTGVFAEAGLNEAAGDIFRMCGAVNPNSNVRVVDESREGLVGPGVPEDDIDAFDLSGVQSYPLPGVSFFFSLAPGSPSLVPAGATPGDILVSQGAGVFALHLTHIVLGLLAADDIDALFIDKWGVPFFSLAPGGPSGLSPGSIYYS